MKNFIEELKNVIAENDFHIYNAVEITNGSTNEACIHPTSLCINSYSVSKAFVVTAIGFLYDAGKIGLDDKITEILAEELPFEINGRYKALTVDHALRHHMGLPKSFLDIDLYHPETFGKDFLATIFCTPPVNEIGTEYIYTDAAYYVLARVVEKIANQPLEDFLRERLFAPLRFRETAWSKCPMGHAMGATGLYLTTHDMAKLGLLYLQGGIWESKQIISREWVNTVLANGYELKDRYNGKCYGKGGMYGQMLLVIPQQNRVVAWHAFDTKKLDVLRQWVCDYKE